ncbi:MAG: hypothetical protein ACJ74V_10445, partial [Gaiellaceae bacterium]
LVALGDVQAALANSERALELSRDIKDPQSLHPALKFRATSLLFAGRRGEAEELVDELLAARPQLNEWWFHDLPWLVLDLGREAEYLEQAKTAPGTLWLQAGAAVAEHDFAAAAALYERIGARGDEAVARLHTAELLAVEGRRAQADEELAKAQAFFEAQGAEAYLPRCEALLAAAS